MDKALALICLLAAAETRFVKLNVEMGLTVFDDPHRLSEDLVRICARDTELSMEQLQRFRQHDFSNVTEATQCFTHCLYEQMGLMRDGVFVERDLLSRVSDLGDPAVWPNRDCFGIRGENKCETAFKIHQCKQQHLAHDKVAVKEQEKQQEKPQEQKSADNPIDELTFELE